MNQQQTPPQTNGINMHPSIISFFTINIPLPIKNGIRIGDWIDEIAFTEVFHLSDTSIRNYQKAGILPSTKWGGKTWFNIAGIIRIFEQNIR
ncbi:MAG: hypothetical protein INR73_26670 [Williamsia sp.]|nr:hypothetical protein [Williamsia sp.]